MIGIEKNFYDIVYFVKIKDNNKGFEIKKETNYKDNFGWVNNTILDSNRGIYATKDKIEICKKKLLAYCIKEAKENLKSAQKEYELLQNICIN
jgi:hypothetical protein